MSMNCKHYEQDLLLLAHGQLEAGAQKKVRQHLHDCPVCGERLVQLSGISLMLSDALQTASKIPPLPHSPRPSFFPSRESWLLSVLLAAFVMVALMGAWKSAKSFAPAPLPIQTTAPGAKDDCLVLPPTSFRTASVKGTLNCLHRHHPTAKPSPFPVKR